MENGPLEKLGDELCLRRLLQLKLAKTHALHSPISLVRVAQKNLSPYYKINSIPGYKASSTSRPFTRDDGSEMPLGLAQSASPDGLYYSCNLLHARFQ